MDVISRKVHLSLYMNMQRPYLKVPLIPELSKRPVCFRENSVPLVLHRSPSLMGIFAADRGFLGEIGGLDGGMTVYGGENVELGIHVSSHNN